MRGRTQGVTTCKLSFSGRMARAFSSAVNYKFRFCVVGYSDYCHHQVYLYRAVEARCFFFEGVSSQLECRVCVRFFVRVQYWRFWTASEGWIAAAFVIHFHENTLREAMSQNRSMTRREREGGLLRCILIVHWIIDETAMQSLMVTNISDAYVSIATVSSEIISRKESISSCHYSNAFWPF